MGNQKLGIGSQIQHPKFGHGVVVDADAEFYKIFFNEGDLVKSIANDYDGLEILEATEAAAPSFDADQMREMIEESVRDAVEELLPSTNHVEIASKWLYGTVEIKAKTDDLQSKEIPVDTFFHKIVMVRDRLRVLEQNINSHDKLDETDKVNLQQYITRAYGSLTTFNVLFAQKEDQFKGTGKQ